MTDGDTPGTPRRRWPLWLALAAVVLGVSLVGVALSRQEPAPPRLDGPVGETAAEPDAPQADAPEADEADDEPVEVGGPRTRPLGPSQPEQITIPAIDVRSELLSLGLADDGTLAVPQPGPDLDKAAWFENSPTPGQPGPAVIEGHVSTDENGPSIFFDLASLRPGDRIEVDRADGSRAVFEVERLEEFAKDRFPTELIYGGDLGSPTLRLITCSSFDPDVGNHTGNLVVFSRLVDVERA